MQEKTERDLVIAMRDAKAKKDEAETALKSANEAYAEAESALIEMMEANDATSTARYEGIGFVTLGKPQLYASCSKEQEDMLFNFLSQEGRTDLIKTSVNSKSLSGFIKERIDEGTEVPGFISYYLKPSARIYKA